MTTTKTILAYEWETKKVHPYDIKTNRAKHPIHMIEGGRYLTEDDTIFCEYSEMGWWGLNKKDYEYVKQHLKEVTLEIIKE